MTKAQQFAMENPCRTVEDCAGAGFLKEREMGGYRVQFSLTIEAWATPVRWHAAIRILRRSGQPKPVAEWDHNDQLLAGRLTREILNGVGAEDDDRFIKQAESLSRYRRATDAELNRVAARILRMPRAKPTPAGAIETVDLREFNSHSWL